MRALRYATNPEHGHSFRSDASTEIRNKSGTWPFISQMCCIFSGLRETDHGMIAAFPASYTSLHCRVVLWEECCFSSIPSSGQEVFHLIVVGSGSASFCFSQEIVVTESNLSATRWLASLAFIRPIRFARIPLDEDNWLLSDPIEWIGASSFTSNAVACGPDPSIELNVSTSTSSQGPPETYCCHSHRSHFQVTFQRCR